MRDLSSVGPTSLDIVFGSNVGSSGYLHSLYAASLEPFAQARLMPRSKGLLLRRRIRPTWRRDAWAGYKMLFCADWSALASDLSAVADVVTVTSVTEPFAGVGATELRRSFPDLVRPYKESFVIDLWRPAPSRHHRAKARRASLSLDVRVHSPPVAFLDDWERLFHDLRHRHDIRGMAALSKSAFAYQLATPGCVGVGAFLDGVCVSMMLWYVMGDVAYYHLGASSMSGYSRSASYAVVAASLDEFAARGLRWLDLGSGAGAWGDPSDGLSRFKRGWSSGTRQTYLCGRIYDHDAYARLTAQFGATGSDFFPAYRSPARPS